MERSQPIQPPLYVSITSQTRLLMLLMAEFACPRTPNLQISQMICLTKGKDAFAGALFPDSITSTVIGIDYKDANYGGDTLVTEVSDLNGCLNTDWGTSSLGLWWNNVISSARAYQYCNHSWHYENTDYGGTTLDCGTACSSMGVMDNETSSIIWRH